MEEYYRSATLAGCTFMPPVPLANTDNVQQALAAAAAVKQARQRAARRAARKGRSVYGNVSATGGPDAAAAAEQKDDARRRRGRRRSLSKGSDGDGDGLADGEAGDGNGGGVGLPGFGAGKGGCDFYSTDAQGGADLTTLGAAGLTAAAAGTGAMATAAAALAAAAEGGIGDSVAGAGGKSMMQSLSSWSETYEPAAHQQGGNNGTLGNRTVSGDTVAGAGGSSSSPKHRPSSRQQQSPPAEEARCHTTVMHMSGVGDGMVGTGVAAVPHPLPSARELGLLPGLKPVPASVVAQQTQAAAQGGRGSGGDAAVQGSGSGGVSTTLPGEGDVTLAELRVNPLGCRMPAELRPRPVVQPPAVQVVSVRHLLEVPPVSQQQRVQLLRGLHNYETWLAHREQMGEEFLVEDDRSAEALRKEAAMSARIVEMRRRVENEKRKAAAKERRMQQKLEAMKEKKRAAQ